MKTSFYFVIWIIIYPLLNLMHNEFIDANSFIIALIVVWGLSYLINRSIPNILGYERHTAAYPLLEDVYTGNVVGFLKRLSTRTTMSIVTALYFVVSTVVIIITFLNDMDEWIAVLIFAFLSWSAMKQSVAMSRIKSMVKSNPTPDQCMQVAENNMRLNYSVYYQWRQTRDYAQMFQPRPKGFVAFLIISVIFAIVAGLLGLVTAVLGIISLFGGVSFANTAFGSMMFLYGSLASYYGIRDTIDCIRSLKNK